MAPYLVPSQYVKPLRRMWRESETETLFLVTHGREYLVEGPYERQDRGQHDQAVLRVFTDFEDAWLYWEQQKQNYQATDQEMCVARTTLRHLWNLIPLIRQNAVAEFDCDVTIDLCRVIDGEPVSVDTLAPAVTLN
jgi:hypothetical protein